MGLTARAEAVAPQWCDSTDGKPVSCLAVRITSLEEARRYPNAALTMEADSGGQCLLTCLVRCIGATSEALTQLLVDLERMTWGNGIDYADRGPPCDAFTYYELLPEGHDIAARFGHTVDGLWLHPELDDELLLRL